MEKVNLEDVKKMKNKELGEKLLTLAGYRFDTASRVWWHKGGRKAEPERLCESLDLVAQVENIVIEKTSFDDYGRCLVGVLGEHGLTQESIAKIATATPRQRAEACLLALQNAPVSDGKGE